MYLNRPWPPNRIASRKQDHPGKALKPAMETVRKAQLVLLPWSIQSMASCCSNQERQASFGSSQQGTRRFRLEVDMQCRCMGCVRKIEKAMASIGSFSGTQPLWLLSFDYFFWKYLIAMLIGVETSVADIDTGIVAVAGKVDPTELCQWFGIHWKWQEGSCVLFACQKDNTQIKLHRIEDKKSIRLKTHVEKLINLQKGAQHRVWTAECF